MKSIVIMLLLGVMTMGYGLTQELSTPKEHPSSMQEFISERIDFFMSSLKIVPGSDKQLPNTSQGSLSKEKLKNIGTLDVKHTKEGKLSSNGIFQVLDFFDETKTKKGTASIIYETSQRTAQLELFKKLVMNSLPLDVVIAQYAVDGEDLGELCLVVRVFDKATGKFVVDGSQIHFIRGNVAVSVHSEDAKVNARELARQMDKILLERNVNE